MDNKQTDFLLGEWSIDPLHNTIKKGATTKKLEKRLMRVLILLTKNPKKGVSKNEILEHVWQDKMVSDETISVAISQLRKALECSAKSPKYIQTISGFGYKLIQQTSAESPKVIPLKKENGHATFLFFKQYLALISFIAITLIILVILLLQAKSPNKESDLLNNDVFAKATYLMQQALDDVQQAEVLLTNLNKQIPNNPEILNTLGKSLLFQIHHLDPAQQTLTTQRAKAYFTQAIALNNEYADVYLQLALIAFYHEHEMKLAEEHFIQAIALDPSQAITHAMYSYLLLTQERNEKGIHHSRIAQSIDPNHYPSPAIQWAYYMAGEYELSKKELAKLYTIDPESNIYDSAALNLYEAQGDEKSAFKYYLKKFRLAGYSEKEMQAATHAFSTGGLKQLSFWLANIKKEQQDIGQYLPPFSTARYHVSAGEYEKAIDFLELAVKNKERDRVWLNADPKYAPLKQFPRFNNLLKTLGFETDG